MVPLFRQLGERRLFLSVLRWKNIQTLGATYTNKGFSLSTGCISIGGNRTEQGTRRVSLLGSRILTANGLVRLESRVEVEWK